MSSTPPLLALPGPQHWYDFVNGEFSICGIPLKVFQEGGQGRGTGWSVWDSAPAVAKHLEQLSLLGRQPDFNPPSVLELGSGTGLAGLAAAAATGLPTTLTDLPEVIPALQMNVDANPQVAPLISVAACDWTAPHLSQLSHPYGLVVAADCVWLEHLVEPFVQTLEAVTGPKSQVVLSYQSRSARVDVLLFSLLGRAFDMQPAHKLPGEPDRGNIDIYWLRRKEHHASRALCINAA